MVPTISGTSTGVPTILSTKSVSGIPGSATLPGTTALTKSAHDNQRRRRVRARNRLARENRSQPTPLDAAAAARLDSHHGSAAMAFDQPKGKQAGKKPRPAPKRLPDCWLCTGCNWWQFACEKDTTKRVNSCFRSDKCGIARPAGCIQWKNATAEQKAHRGGTVAAGAAPPATPAAPAAAGAAPWRKQQQQRRARQQQQQQNGGGTNGAKGAAAPKPAAAKEMAASSAALLKMKAGHDGHRQKAATIRAALG